MRARHLVRFVRRFENYSIGGFVLDVGPKFFLLSLVSDRIRFDGFEVFRAQDVSELREDPYSLFVRTALTKRAQRRPRKPRVSVAAMSDVLRSAGRAFPIVALHLEEVDAHVCHIGRVVDVTRRRVSLLEIGPDASWDSTATEYELKDVTRVNFGGDYEDALRLVGGEPPAG
jgi:hypothetical protein